MCNCDFHGDADSYHFLRHCEACKEHWYSLHCPHDGVQRPCPNCGMVHVPVPAETPVCVYCKRVTTPKGTPGELEATDDHYIPASLGGIELVTACWFCNNLKLDRHPEAWRAFMAQFPMWWRTHKRKPGPPGRSRKSRWNRKGESEWQVSTK